MGLRLHYICFSAAVCQPDDSVLLCFKKRDVSVTFFSRWQHVAPANTPVSCEFSVTDNAENQLSQRIETG